MLVSLVRASKKTLLVPLQVSNLDIRGRVFLRIVLLVLGACLVTNLPAYAAKVELFDRVGCVGAVNCLAFSPDKKLLVSGDDFAVRVWELSTCQKLKTLIGHTGKVIAVDFTRDGRRIVSASNDGSIRVWDSTSGRSLRTIQVAETLVQMVISPDSKLLAHIDGDNVLRITDFSSGKVIGTLPDKHCGKPAFSPDGKRLASYNLDNVAKVWSVADGAELGKFGEPYSNEYFLSSKAGVALAFSADGQFLTCGNAGNIVKVWDIDSGKLIASVNGPQAEVKGFVDQGCIFQPKPPSPGLSLEISRDAKLAVIRPNATEVKLINTPSGECLRVFEDNNRPLCCEAFSRDNSILAAGSLVGSIKVWNVQTGSEVGAMNGSSVMLFDLNVSSDGETLAAACDDRIRLWSLRVGGSCRQCLDKEGTTRTVSFSPDSRSIVCGNSKGNVTVWSIEHGVMKRLSERGWGYTNLCFSPDGQLIMAIDHNLKVVSWNFQSGIESQDRVLDITHATGFTFRPDGKEAAISLCGELLVRDSVSSHNLLSTRKAHPNLRGLAYSPSGNLLAVAYENGLVKVVEVASARQLAVFEMASKVAPSLAFSPDGKLLAIGDKYRGVRLWRVGSSEQLKIIDAKPVGAFSIAFTRDGKNILSASHDGAIRIYSAGAWREKGSIHFLGGPEWVVSDRSGNFDATSLGDSLLVFRAGRGFKTLNNLGGRHRQAGLLARLLNSK